MNIIGIYYFLVVILANTIGAVSGMGGGVIIKPIFDAISAHDVSSISFYSSVAVFVMAIVSTTMRLSHGVRLDWKKVFALSFGAVLGGYLGSSLFEYLKDVTSSDTLVEGIQISLTCLTLLLSLMCSRNPPHSYQIHHPLAYVLSGCLLGTLASLLGIGGGPINVSFFMFLFSMPIKEATVYSIATILFSQLTKIVTISVTVGFASFDLSMLVYIIPAAILGGLLGARCSKLFTPKTVAVCFQIVVLLVLGINLYNGLRLFW